jgi:hypothetical protein
MEHEFSDHFSARARVPTRARSLLLSQELCDPAARWAATLSHADVLLIGHHDQARIQLLDQLAAIAELNPVQVGDLRSFEADWRGMPLRVETVVTADLPTVVARAELADYLVPVIPEVDGPMPRDREQLTGTPPRLEVPAVFCVAPAEHR